MLTRRQFISSAAVALPPAQARKPNLLFVIADQWRAQTLPSAGDLDLKAPNLARLTAQGVSFSRTYTSNPVCTPSRAAMLTGKFPHAVKMPHNDLQLPLDEVCIAGQLKKFGYSTGYIGKWHIDGEERPGFVPPGPRRRGFDYWAAFNRGHFYYNSTYFRDTPEPIKKDGFEPDYQTDLAIDFIRQNKAKPFCLYLSWGPPHTPRKAPESVKGLYDPKRFHLRENIPAGYEAKARDGYTGYYGLCSALDRDMGRLLATLDENGLADDTIVLFTADHGDMLGSHGLEFKGVPYEESARIPFLMRYPRALKGGSTNDMLVSNVDYMPTLLSLCGAQIPDGVQGRDLSQPILTGEGKRPEAIYCEGKLGQADEWRMLVRGYDKLVVNTKFEPTHFYNLAEDPYEMKNLATDKGQLRRLDELTAVLKSWMRRTGDRVPYPVKTRPSEG
jgi:arylsulfatase A-like enzyme